MWCLQFPGRWPCLRIQTGNVKDFSRMHGERVSSESEGWHQCGGFCCPSACCKFTSTPTDVINLVFECQTRFVSFRSVFLWIQTDIDYTELVMVTNNSVFFFFIAVFVLEYVSEISGMVGQITVVSSQHICPHMIHTQLLCRHIFPLRLNLIFNLPGTPSNKKANTTKSVWVLSSFFFFIIGEGVWVKTSNGHKLTHKSQFHVYSNNAKWNKIKK